MVTALAVCGFECEVFNFHWSGQNGSIFTTSRAHKGGASVRFHPIADSNFLTSRISGTIQVVRVYVFFDVLPDADSYIIYSGASTGRQGLVFHFSSGELRCATGNTPTTGGAGVPIETGKWYRCDVRLDHTSGAKVVDAEIDGAACVSANWADTHAASALTIGLSDNVTADVYFDDFLISNTSGDYPVGSGFVNAFVPTSDGVHNIPNAGEFQRGLTGVDITNDTTDAYRLVDELPPSISILNDDFIAAIATTDRSDYVEVRFGAATGSVRPSVPPRVVDVLTLTYNAGGDGFESMQVNLVDDGLTEPVYRVNTPYSNTPGYNHRIMTPPSGASGWTLAGNGNFNDLRARFYSFVPGDGQYLQGILVEAEFAAEDTVAVDTWQFDTPEPNEADRDPIDYYLAWQLMDNSAESQSKLLSAARVTGKLNDAELQIHGYAPGETISKSDIEDGANAKLTIPLTASTTVKRHKRKKIKSKNLSVWAPRLSGTWDGTGDRDRLDELIIEGRPHGTQK